MTLEVGTSLSQPAKGRIRLAWIVAAAADAIQIGGFPVFGEGFMSPLNDALDVVVAIALIYLVGWHIAFVPTIVVKALPFADLAPTWTLAVFIATRGKGKTPEAPARLPE